MGWNPGLTTACSVSFKAQTNGRNKCQQLPTLLGVVGQQCCVCLHGPKSLTVLNYTQQVPTSAKIVVVPCKRTQQVTTLMGPTMLGVVGQQCWVRLHGTLERHLTRKLKVLGFTNPGHTTMLCPWERHFTRKLKVVGSNLGLTIVSCPSVGHFTRLVPVDSAV